MKCALLSGRGTRSVAGAIRFEAVAVSALVACFSASAANVSLAWDPSTDPSVTGYNLYYGGGSRNYTNIVDARKSNTVSVSNLVVGSTYYFAATAYNAAGLESDYSVEVAYAVPSGTNSNAAPTLAQPADVIVNENSGPHTVTLTGISSGSPNEPQVLDVSAFSSNPALVPQPAVIYTSPNSTASLTLTPAPDSYGSCTMTVSVYDHGAVSNTTIRSFGVTVLPVNNPPTLDALSDVTIDENSGVQSVNLTGITPGTGETEPVTVTASSSNPSLIPEPSISYSGPNTGGVLTFTPAANQYGSSRITVSVDDRQATNRLTSRSFMVTVRQGDAGGGTNDTASTAWTLWWQNTGGATAVWNMDGTNSTKSTRLNVASVDPAWRMAGQADFDGDGQTDILWQHTDTSVALWLMQETNCTRMARLGNGPIGQGWRLAATGDLNTDGHPDIVWQHASGTTAVWFMEGTNCIERARLNAPAVSSGWTLVGAGHFSTSGYTDLLWQNTGGSLALWRMDGTNLTGSFRLSTPAAGAGWHIVALPSINGSGQTDILWQHENGSVAYWLMDATNRVGMGRLYPQNLNPAWRVVGPK